MRTYGKSLLPRARKMRKTPTDAERKFWAHVRQKRFRGLPFQRQVPMGGYIADFVCHSAKLVIELDGGQHANEEAVGYDLERTRFFESLGFRVIRFWNRDVMKEIEVVLEKLDQEIGPH